MDKNALLDMIELIDEERRMNESLAFSSKDASEKVRLEKVARRDAAAISDIRRKLAPKRHAARRLPTSKRQFDAYIDNLLDTCFEATHAEPARHMPDGGIPSAHASR
jgi:hypothetical protein